MNTTFDSNSPGFAEFVRKLKERRVLQGVSELFAAMFFHQAGFHIRFNHGSKRGDDYDLLAESQFFNVAIETKTAGLEAEPRIDFLKTIKNCVKSASTQLPKEGINVIFLLVAQDLVSSEEAAWAIKNTIFDEALRQTSRVHAVSFGCESLDELTQRCGLSNTTFPHPKSSDVVRGRQVAHLLRRVPSVNVGATFGKLAQLNLEQELQEIEASTRRGHS